MKTIKLHISILLMIIGLSTVGYAQQLDQMPCYAENTAFYTGERLVYKLYYNWQFIWIPAGEVVFSVDETPTTYEITVTGNTYPSYDSFFKVRDFYFSSVDKETLQPNYFIRDIVEGNYIRYDSIIFNSDSHLVEEHLGKTRASTELYAFEYGDCVQDMVSILYLLRNIEDDHIKEGYTLPINVFFDKEFYNLDINVLKKEKKYIKGLGRQKAIQISPQIVTGNVFQNGNEMNIWVSDNESKIPLMIESAVSVGSVKAVLISHENTKDQIID